MLELLFAILAVLSLGLTVWRWAAARAFALHHHINVPPGPLLGLTILKPLKGCNEEIKRCLRSWLIQEYSGPVQVLFGVADAEDPVCAVVRELLAEFPKADAQLVICAEKRGGNGKVSTLCQLEPLIRHPLIIISDADVEIDSSFTATVAPILSAPGAGLVNCFYCLANPSTLAMRWEAVAINSDFWSQVLQARSMGPVDFALGAVMCLPAGVLPQIGGFAHLVDYLADDYELGQSVTRAGGRIDFAHIVVDCREAPHGWVDVWSHQLRWARTIRVCRPVSYFLSILGNATLWPFLWLLAARNSAAALFCVVALLFRIGSAAQQQKKLTQSDDHAAYWWLPPVKDILDLFIWGAAFWGSRVKWRGEPYQVLRGGKLVRVAG